MEHTHKIFSLIDQIISQVDLYKIEPLFSNEKNHRFNKVVPNNITDNEILKTFAFLIAYSQNANSERVEQTISSGNLERCFCNFDLESICRLNPCDVVDNYWESIKGIRQQSKVFHIISLARKIKSVGSISTLF